MMNEKDFLLEFFGNENGYSLELINSNTNNQNKIRPWVKRLLENKETVLPLNWKNKQIYWYGITFSDEQFNRLGEDLRYFIGRTYSSFIPVRANPVRHPIDQAVNDFTEGRFYRFHGNSKHIFNQLEYLRSMWEVRPHTDMQQTTSIGRILRNFFMTLRLGPAYRQKAENYIEELQNRKLLNAVNILFLQIQMLAEYDEWDEILSLNSLSDLMNMRRPLAVTEALLKAIYNRELKSKENRVEDLIETYKNIVNPNYGLLISSRGSFKSSEALILLMLNAVTIKQDLTAVNELLKVPMNNPTRNLLERISHKFVHETDSVIGEGVEVDTINLAHKAIIKGKFDFALSILKDLDPAWEMAILLFQCAYQLQTLESREYALKSYQQLSTEEQKEFMLIRQNKEYLDEITEGHSTENIIIPDGWLSWFENLEHYTPMKNFYHASEGANEWSIDEMLDPEYPIDEFIRQLYACYDNEHKKESLYFSFPHILGFFQKDLEWPRREFQNIYVTLLELLSFNEEKGETELSLFQNLLEALLQIGVNKEKYIEIIQIWKMIWSEMASYNYLENGISILETLLAYPCPAEEERLGLFLDFSNLLQAFVRKLNRNDRKVLQYLYSDFRQNETWALIEGQNRLDETLGDNRNNWEFLSGKTIGIYTLMESVSLRVRDIIKSNNNKINVIINNEKSGSESLKNMVKSSNILLIATASAKHAATIFIEQHMDENIVLLRPEGKGSSSMLNILEKYTEMVREEKLERISN